MKDYQDFVDSKPQDPRKEVSKSVFNYVEKGLETKLRSVIGKLTIVNMLAAVFTLSFCPQFGLGPWLAEGHGIMHFLMPYGDIVCAMFCGFVFFGFSALASRLVLKVDDLIIIRQHLTLHACGIVFAGLFAFLMLDATTAAATVALGVGFAWSFVGFVVTYIYLRYVSGQRISSPA